MDSLLKELITEAPEGKPQSFPTESLEATAAVIAGKMVKTAKEILTDEDQKDAAKIAAGVKKIMELVHRDLERAGY